jgi:hypothetical protein
VQQLFGGRALEHVRRRTYPEGFGRKLGVVVHGQEHESHAGELSPDSLSGLKATEPGHGNITHNRVGLVLQCGCNQGFAIGDPSEHRKFGLQQPPESFQKQVVIVGKE